MQLGYPGHSCTAGLSPLFYLSTPFSEPCPSPHPLGQLQPAHHHADTTLGGSLPPLNYSPVLTLQLKALMMQSALPIISPRNINRTLQEQFLTWQRPASSSNAAVTRRPASWLRAAPATAQPCLQKCFRCLASAGPASAFVQLQMMLGGQKATGPVCGAQGFAFLTADRKILAVWSLLRKKSTQPRKPKTLPECGLMRSSDSHRFLNIKAGLPKI